MVLIVWSRLELVKNSNVYAAEDTPKPTTTPATTTTKSDDTNVNNSDATNNINNESPQTTALRLTYLRSRSASAASICPQPGAVRALRIYQNSRASARSERMKAKPEWFAERARTEHRRPLAGRGAEWLRLVSRSAPARN